LRSDLEAQRSGAFERARKAVESARYRALVLDALSWLEDGDWIASADELTQAKCKRGAKEFARDEIARRAKKVTRRAAKIEKLDPRGRHKLRIAAKKLRYATGFFESLFPGRKERKRLRSFERELKAMQDCLGALNDITVHQRLASEFVRRGTRRRERVFAI